MLKLPLLKLCALLLLLPLGLLAQNPYKKVIDSLLLIEAKTKQDTARATVQNKIAQYYAYNRDTLNAFKYADMAMAISKKHNYKNGIIDAYLSYAEAYGLSEVVQKERDYLNKVISLCTDKNNITRKIKALERLGINVAYTDDLKKGVGYLKESARLAKETGNDKGYSTAIFQIGGAYHNKGRLYDAAGYYQQVIAFNEKRDVLVMASAAIYLGGVYRAQENDTKALELYLRALKIVEERKVQSNFVAMLTNNIGDIYADKKEYKKALEYYRKGEKMLQKHSYPTDLAEHYLKLSKLYSKTGDNGLSENYFNKAAAIKGESQQRNYYLKRMLGENRFEAEKYTEALAYHLEAFDLVSRSNLEETGLAACNLAAARFKVAKANNDKGKMLSQAIEGLEYGLSIFKETKSISKLYGFSDYLADAYEFKGDNKKALEAYKNFIAYRDSVHEKDKWNDFTMQQSKYEFDKEQTLLKAKQKAALEHEQTNRNYAYAGIGVFVFISIGAGVAYSRKRKDNRIIASEKKRSDELLLNILPAEVAEELKAKGEAGARYFDHVSILFTDFVGFTKLSEKFSPEELIGELNYCFKAFDEIITRHNIEKIKTIGDSYMAVSGLPAGNNDHAINAVNAAIEMRNFIDNYKAERQAQGRVYFEMRTGINSGQVVAGIVGIKKFAYDVWGDAVNIASRMESNGAAGKVNISESTFELIKDHYETEYRGELEAKGKGEIKMYFVEHKPNGWT